MLKIASLLNSNESVGYISFSAFHDPCLPILYTITCAVLSIPRFQTFIIIPILPLPRKECPIGLSQAWQTPTYLLKRSNIISSQKFSPTYLRVNCPLPILSQHFVQTSAITFHPSKYWSIELSSFVRIWVISGKNLIIIVDTKMFVKYINMLPKYNFALDVTDYFQENTYL